MNHVSSKSSTDHAVLTLAVLFDKLPAALLMAYGGSTTFTGPVYSLFLYSLPKIGVFGAGGRVVRAGGSSLSIACWKGSVQGALQNYRGEISPFHHD